jgi:hypothetical protein
MLSMWTKLDENIRNKVTSMLRCGKYKVAIRNLVKDKLESINKITIILKYSIVC